MFKDPLTYTMAAVCFVLPCLFASLGAAIDAVVIFFVVIGVAELFDIYYGSK